MIFLFVVNSETMSDRENTTLPDGTNHVQRIRRNTTTRHSDHFPDANITID
jgi:hypothetical protein